MIAKVCIFFIGFLYDKLNLLVISIVFLLQVVFKKTKKYLQNDSALGSDIMFSMICFLIVLYHF